MQVATAAIRAASQKTAALESTAILIGALGLFISLLGLVVVAGTPMLRGRNFGLMLAAVCADNVLDVALRLATPTIVIGMGGGSPENNSFASALCAAQGFLSVAWLFAMHGVVALISIDRYFQIVHPLRANQLLSRRRIIAALAVCHLFAFSVAALPLIDPRRFGGYSFSEHALTSLPTGSMVYIKVAIMCIFLAVFMAFYCHMHILGAMMRQARRSHSSRCCPRAQARLRRGLALCVGLVLFTLICLVPHMVVTAAGSVSEPVPPVAMFAGAWAVVLNNSVTPGMYMLTYRDFRHAARRSMCCCRRSKPRSSYRHLASMTLSAQTLVSASE